MVNNHGFSIPPKEDDGFPIPPKEDDGFPIPPKEDDGLSMETPAPSNLLATLVNHWFLLFFCVFGWFFDGFWSKNHGY